MNNLNYPPIIEGKLPAFIKPTTGHISVAIPFKLSGAVGYNDFSHMRLKLKTITTGLEKYVGDTSKANITFNRSTNTYVAIFNIAAAADINKINAAQFYKAQVAFVKYNYNTTSDTTKSDTKTYYTYNSSTKIYSVFTGNAFATGTTYYERSDSVSPMSSVGIIKCTSPINLTIQNLTSGALNANPVSFTGMYKNTDTTEKVYSYCFTMYDDNNQVFETSGDLIHNSSSDETKLNASSSKMEYTAVDTWSLTKSLLKGKIYRIAYSVKTINDYHSETSPYSIKEASTVDANIPAKLLADVDNDNGCVNLKFIKPKEINEEIPFSGNFVITRYSENLNTWNEIFRFNMMSQTPSDMGTIWTDYTIEHGVKYLYAIQAYNSNNLYSNKELHVIRNPYNQNSYLEAEDENNPYYIYADFEDAFLTDGDRQLKIRYNPKVSSFKSTILESKVDTLGGRYPFIFRNGNVNYKEFPISGLLSYLGDEKELFANGIYPEEYSLVRTKTAAAGSQTPQAQLNIPDAGTKLTSDNFYRERQFKMAVLEWLNNGQPKLFRSPGEGSYIVRLMNTSLTPNDQLGRMLHTFSATAYEIAEHNFENLKKYNLLSLPNEDNRIMKFAEVAIGTSFIPDFPMHYAFILDATPGTQYKITQTSAVNSVITSIEIGATGVYYVDPDTDPVTAIELVSGDATGTAKVHYGYYDTSVPDNFSYISNVTSKDEMAQFIGHNKNIEIISTYLEDIRRQTGDFYTIIARPRPITTIYVYNNKFYKDVYHKLEITEGWSELEIYYVSEEGKYYDGNPNNKVTLGSTPPPQEFKLNNKYILDLSTGLGHLIDDPLVDPPVGNPEAQKLFVPGTNGSYWVSNFGEVDTIHLSSGVYIEMAYEIKEIDYSIEDEDLSLKAKKQAWITLLNDYNSETPTVTKQQVDTAYTAYITALEAALEAVFEEDGQYAL